ncbi:LysR substrate-binding domain-containing protein [Dyella subtropica]|uniref:LysR substrate-binding domain-containing protein n=1 Tax=Dyella subtropica TaxID=2992127 RepID=UPI00225B085A|nr:LysR substrate-binding domain-containing protein [Dyella subtropica]
MTRRVNFDLDVLRSFSLGVELGSFAKAADRLGRSTSAVSAQLKKLEDQAGTEILRRHGRGMALTEAGETMLAYARRLLELNDEAAAAIHGVALEGWIRLGLQEDFGESLLPDVLGRFARAHPKVRIEARIARNSELLDRVTTGRLDLALAWDAGIVTPHVERIGEVPMCWIGSGVGELGWSRDGDEPLPLVSLDAPCLMRTAATTALDRAGIPWRIAFTSASLAGIWAAVAAGLGVALRTRVGLPGTVRGLDAREAGLPEMPLLGLNLHRAEKESAPAIARLEDILRQRLEGFPWRA